MNTDKSPVRSDKMTEIPVKIGKQTKFISGVNDFTKCSDIITGVLKSEKILDVEEEAVSQHYALLESWRGVTKLLNGNSPILRIWLAWAAEQPHVTFVVKRIRNPRVVSSTSKVLDEGVGHNWMEKMRAQVRQRDEAEPSAVLGQLETVKQKTNANKERRLSRRNSSLNRPRRPPDTLHPAVVKKEAREVLQLERNIKEMVARTSAIKELYRLKPTVKTELKHDTSEDSGIVTDDSEARGGGSGSKYYDVRRKSFPRQENKIYYEELWTSKPSSNEPQTLLKAPPDDSKFYEMAQDIENLQKINLLLEENQEQILALEFEYKMLLEDQRSPVRNDILDDFRAEVTKFRDVNTDLLQKILYNRTTIEEFSKTHRVRKQVLSQLEFDMNVVEREGKRLESNLEDLNSLDLTSSKELPENVTKRPEDLMSLPSTLV